MGGCSSCQQKGINLDSFHGRIQWSLRCTLTFVISALCAYFFPDYLAVPYLLPLMVLIATRRNFGMTMLVCQGIYQGITLICIISTIAFYIPILKPELWWCTLIYHFLVSLFLCVVLHNKHGARKLALAFQSIYVQIVGFNENEETPEMVYFWKTWLMVPMTWVIASIGVLVPVPIFAYQQLIFTELDGARILKEWLRDMMEYLYHSRDNKIVSKVQWHKLQKYVDEARRSRASIEKLRRVAAAYEMVHSDNLMIDPKRIQSLLDLHYILVGMHDTVRHLQYDDLHYDLFDAIRRPLKLFVAEILDRLDDISGQHFKRES